MSTPLPESQPTSPGGHAGHAEEGSGWKHWGWMLLCCLPMIAFAILLLLGVWGAR